MKFVSKAASAAKRVGSRGLRLAVRRGIGAELRLLTPFSDSMDVAHRNVVAEPENPVFSISKAELARDVAAGTALGYSVSSGGRGEALEDGIVVDASLLLGTWWKDELIASSLPPLPPSPIEEEPEAEVGYADVAASGAGAPQGKRVLSLGGTGFLGRKLVREMIESDDIGAIVMVVKPGERLPFKSDKITYVDQSLTDPAIRGVKGESFWHSVLKDYDIDVVQHAAGVAAATKDDTYAINTDSVAGILAGIRASGRNHTRIVYVSSGDTERTKIVHRLTDKMDAYGDSKLKAEEMLAAADVMHVIVRPDYILPEVDKETGVVEDAHNPHMHNFVAFPDGVPVFLPDGSEELTFNPISSRDVARGVLKLTVDDSHDGRTLDACGHDKFTLREMLGFLAGVQGHKAPPIVPLDIEPTAAFAGAVNKGAMCAPLTLAARVPEAERRFGKLSFRPEDWDEIVSDREGILDVYKTKPGVPLRFAKPDVIGVVGGMLQHPITVTSAAARLATSPRVLHGLLRAAMPTDAERELPPRSKMYVERLEKLRRNQHAVESAEAAGGGGGKPLQADVEEREGDVVSAVERVSRQAASDGVSGRRV